MEWEALANAEQGWQGGLFQFHVIVISCFVLFPAGFLYSRLASNPYGIMGMQQRMEFGFALLLCVFAPSHPMDLVLGISQGLCDAW